MAPVEPHIIAFQIHCHIPHLIWPFNAERQIYLQCTVLCSFPYNMNVLRYIVLILAQFCKYWNVLDVQVKTFVLSPLLQLLWNINFCWEFFPTPLFFILDSQLLFWNLLGKMQYTNIQTIDIRILNIHFKSHVQLQISNLFHHPRLPQAASSEVYVGTCKWTWHILAITAHWERFSFH